jgi:spermidine synthase
MTSRWYVYLAVIVSGGSVLAVEILGARLIGPFYGGSLYLWSTLISVTLGALSLGYFLGGRWADRGPRLGRLCTLLGGAGLWITVMPWIRHPILAATESMGLRGAVLIAAITLFFPPLTLLGMVSPYAVRLKTTSLDVVGRAAGELYAISTLASVAAALGTGFILIPAVGAGRLMFLTGCTLIVTALIGGALARARTAPVIIVMAAATAAALFVTPEERANPQAGLIAITQSPYAEIRVVDVDNLRLMLIDGMVHTEVDARTLDSHSSYVDVLELAAGFYESPGRMLLVGLGGGSLAKRFTANDWKVDAVEIDTTVTRIARSYFGLRPSEAHVYHMDGREFLMEHEDVYDLIIIDAFGSSSIPFQLVSREAFAECRARLAPNGVIALNAIAVGWRDKLVRSLAATLSQEFDHVVVLPMAEPPDQLGNVILFASNRALELAEEPPVPLERFSPEYSRAHAWDNRFQIDPAGEQVITDDLNPVDLWTEHINLAMRKSLHEYFGKRRIGW